MALSEDLKLRPMRQTANKRKYYNLDKIKKNRTMDMVRLSVFLKSFTERIVFPLAVCFSKKLNETSFADWHFTKARVLFGSLVVTF